MIHAIANHDSQAVLSLRSSLLRHASRLVRGDSHAAEDLVQDAFLRTLQRGGQAPDCPSSWYHRVLRNRAAHRWARAGSFYEESAEMSELGSAVGDPVSTLDRKEADAALASALQSLPAHYRRPLELRYLEGRGLGEVAELLGLPYHTVRTQQRRGLEKLRDILGDHPWYLGAAKGRGSRPRKEFQNG